MLQVLASDAFLRWELRMRDQKALAKIRARIERIAFRGVLVGDFKFVGHGVCELRFDVGPGYRVYLALEEGRMLLLYCAGDKSTQARDIERAQRLAERWRRSHEL